MQVKHNLYSSQLLTFTLPLDKVKCIIRFHVYDMDGADPMNKERPNVKYSNY